MQLDVSTFIVEYLVAVQVCDAKDDEKNHCS